SPHKKDSAAAFRQQTCRSPALQAPSSFAAPGLRENCRRSPRRRCELTLLEALSHHHSFSLQSASRIHRSRLARNSSAAPPLDRWFLSPHLHVQARDTPFLRVPAVVAVHRVIPPHQRCNFAHTQLAHLLLQLTHEIASIVGRRVAPVHK